jgi:predicted ATPase/DNA-binding SARP family transcriptional activator
VEPRPRSIEIRLLGPIELRIDGRTTALGGPRQRTLLALVALRPGQVLPVDELIEELWAGEPPEGATTTLRSYVSRLRRSLNGLATLEHTDRGYILDVAPASIDALEFERLVRTGGERLANGAVRRARELLGDALNVWRGRPFGDLGGDGGLAVAAERLDELRLLALERRIEADLELGRAAEVVDELEAAVREFPFRERLWRHLMLALYRAGRQAEALAAFQRARSQLDEQLGIEPGDELEQLQVAILRHEVPDATPPEHRTNLPAPLTSFIGRPAEVAEVTGLLQSARLVTLTGVGGVGKTRLALETARRALPDVPGGVYFVDLSPLGDGSMVAGQLAAALGIREQAGRPPLDLVSSQVREQEILLVLDNCEHLREAVASLAARLLEAAPRLRILATSRELLGVPGEVDLAVPPLGLPDTDDVDVLRGSEAVALFLTRALAARPTLVDDAATVRLAAQIVADLDGLPLAIELAAARAKALSLPDIASRLGDRFRFLRSWRRLVSSRHRTLREAMDWSYELLVPEEQALLAGISVFAGGFTIRSVAGVCLEGDEDAALLIVERLAEASLVVPVVTVTPTRYRLLETVRQYGLERLRDAGGDRDLARRHAEWFLELARSANLGYNAAGEQRFDVVVAEEDNLRSALGWALGSGEVELGLRICIALKDYWVASHGAQGVQWIEAFRATGVQVPRDVRAASLLVQAYARWMSGGGQAMDLYEESLAEFEALGDEAGRAHVLDQMAFAATMAGDIGRAQALGEESLAAHRRVGNPRGESQALGALARVASLRGEHQHAVELVKSSVTLAAETGYRWWQMAMVSNVGEYALDDGQLDVAEAACREALDLARRLDDPQIAVFMFAVLARIAIAEGRYVRAGLLWGALEAEEARAPHGEWLRQRDYYAGQVLPRADAGFEAGRAAGRALSLDAAIDAALRE